MFLGAGSVMHGMDDDVDMRHYGALRKAMPVTFLTFAMGYLAIIGVPRLLRLLVQGQDHRGRARRRTGWSALLRPARRRHHRLLHDPADADDLLQREALGGGRPPARVAQGDDGPADRARRAVRRSAACCCSATGSSTASRRSSATAPARGAAASRRWRSRLIVLVVVAVGVAVAWFLVGQREVPREAPQDVSFVTRAARADLYGDAINEDAGRPARRAPRRAAWRPSTDDGVDGVVEGGRARGRRHSARSCDGPRPASSAPTPCPLLGGAAARRPGPPGGEPRMNDFPWLTVLIAGAARRRGRRPLPCPARPRRGAAQAGRARRLAADPACSRS